jgi:hypothetical protein
MPCLCPNCRFDTAVPALSRVTYHVKSWGGSPAPWLSGGYTDLHDLIAAGYARKNSAGWIEPAEAFPAP